MKKEPLSKTNPYLQDASKRAEMIRRAVESSTAIEGVRVHLPVNSSKKLKDKS